MPPDPRPRSPAWLPVCEPSGPYPRTVEILYWLVAPVVVTVVAMLWVGWFGREGRGEIDRDVAVRRLADALQKEPPAHASVRPTAVRDRSTGIAVRPSRAPRPPAPGGERPRRSA